MVHSTMEERWTTPEDHIVWVRAMVRRDGIGWSCCVNHAASVLASDRIPIRRLLGTVSLRTARLDATAAARMGLDEDRGSTTHPQSLLCRGAPVDTQDTVSICP